VVVISRSWNIASRAERGLAHLYQEIAAEHSDATGKLKRADLG
jgi:hypothetical protein